jgi:hypothetical protein
MKRMLAALALFGCSPPYAEMLASASSSAGGTSTGSTSAGATTSTSGSSSTSTSGPITGADDATSYNIITELDFGAGGPCDVWSQDCPPGEKCMPYANDGGGAWNSAGCFPLDEDPKDPGEPCTVFGDGGSGLDDCGPRAMCWNVDPETKMGECVGMCAGSEANPVCGDPCTNCMINGEGVLVLCLPACDPLAQDCGQGSACYPIVTTFACAPDVSGMTGAAGDPCAFINVCDAGLLCAAAPAVPGCESSGCCTPFCDVDEPDDCNEQVPGSVCVALFDIGEYSETCLPTGTIGFCAVPP